MNEKLKVEILSGGTTAVEINEMQEPEEWQRENNANAAGFLFYKELFEEAESKLREFEIAREWMEVDGEQKLVFYREPGSIHSAEVLESGKVRIV